MAFAVAEKNSTEQPLHTPVKMNDNDIGTGGAVLSPPTLRSSAQQLAELAAYNTNLGARLAAVGLAKNPLLEAARPLLRALCDMPEYLEDGAIAVLRSMLEQEVRTFQKLCEQTNIRRDHVLGARYCLCTALDESAMQTTWGKAGKGSLGKWTTDGLATTFHEDREGGDKVYYLIGRLMTEPKEHLDLLEVIYRILSLGFEGRFRVDADGRRKHDAVRQRVYTEITTQRGPVPVPLSPHWEGDNGKRSGSIFEFPVWITAAVLSLILLGFYGYAKYELMTRGAAVEKQIADIGRMTPPPAPQRLHLQELLKNEISSGKVGVDEDERQSAVTFRGDDMFVAGKSTVNASMQPLIAKIAAEIIKVSGKVTVIGHTDSTPIRSRAFASNQALSEERATQVMQMLHDSGVAASRLEAIGKGDTAPVADDKTFQGRARNRRVEINVAE